MLSKVNLFSDVTFGPVTLGWKEESLVPVNARPLILISLLRGCIQHIHVHVYNICWTTYNMLAHIHIHVHTCKKRNWVGRGGGGGERRGLSHVLLSC